VILIHQRYRQTDGRTDRRTTCDRKTALCTKVHRAVKSVANQQYNTLILHKTKRKKYEHMTVAVNKVMNKYAD